MKIQKITVFGPACFSVFILILLSFTEEVSKKDSEDVSSTITELSHKPVALDKEVLPAKVRASSKTGATNDGKPRKLVALSYNYSDSEDEETREERKARLVSMYLIGLPKRLELTCMHDTSPTLIIPTCTCLHRARFSALVLELGIKLLLTRRSWRETVLLQVVPFCWLSGKRERRTILEKASKASRDGGEEERERRRESKNAGKKEKDAAQ